MYLKYFINFGMYHITKIRLQQTFQKDVAFKDIRKKPTFIDKPFLDFLHTQFGKMTDAKIIVENMLILFLDNQMFDLRINVDNQLDTRIVGRNDFMVDHASTVLWYRIDLCHTFGLMNVFYDIVLVVDFTTVCTSRFIKFHHIPSDVCRYIVRLEHSQKIKGDNISHLLYIHF